MKTKDIISFAGKNITRKKTQSSLTIIGIVIGILAIVSLISLGYGVQNYIRGEITTVGADIISILPSQEFGGPVSGKNFKDKDVNAIKNVKGISNVLPGWFGGQIIEYRDQKSYANTYLITPSIYSDIFINSFGYSLDSGRWLNDNDKNSCILGYNVAKNTFNREVRVGDRVTIGDNRYKVVGILKETGNPRNDNAITLPYESSNDLFKIKDEYNIITVSVRPGEDVVKISEDIKKEIEKSRGDENFSVLTSEQLAESINSIFSVLTLFLVGVAGISLLVGAVGISNTMHMSILERRKDIGILKALGAENNTILSIFVIEAGFLGLFGGIIGTVFGILIAKAIEYFAKIAGYGLIRAWISPELIFGVLIFSFVVGILSGYFPARSGAKLNPVDTLRGE
ncbi:protein of unknown function DUF214 [Methanococcus vannielii SB]|uniref:ABC3 transporter permease protein domain-containing protein n=1 Tax=Methanococcus vannielii (strain ATCC 35089 / DSM 1224 / JCM 13029 / OCM 148 / SB) TaxID=406327 RepID=A6UN92_METVS|nr:ABC transporter permease [Methanococcus vannielii]ABR53964.1 protein of unknown function DUF214 [Methanococcus vannielii SB]